MNNDLISREALKKALHNFFDGKVIDEPAYILRDVFYHIDNAPTVKSYTLEDLEKAKNNGYKWGKIDGRAMARPQGEWIAREDMDFLDENKVIHNHFMCEKCGFIHDFIDGHTSQYKFCPQCGADMRKGEWIPVSERLPEYSGLYLISIYDLVTVANFTGKYFCDRQMDKFIDVMAWQPLPEPYKKGGAE